MRRGRFEQRGRCWNAGEAGARLQRASEGTFKVRRRQPRGPVRERLAMRLCRLSWATPYVGSVGGGEFDPSFPDVTRLAAGDLRRVRTTVEKYRLTEHVNDFSHRILQWHAMQC